MFQIGTVLFEHQRHASLDDRCTPKLFPKDLLGKYSLFGTGGETKQIVLFRDSLRADTRSRLRFSRIQIQVLLPGEPASRPNRSPRTSFHELIAFSTRSLQDPAGPSSRARVPFLLLPRAHVRKLRWRIPLEAPLEIVISDEHDVVDQQCVR
jgi:hypothetical protein